MSEQETHFNSRHETWNLAYHIFLRLLALFFVAMTLQIWMRAIGISDANQMGFDTMPTHWQIAIASLCVIYPVTALGLWGLFAWGIAVWLIGVLGQLVMYLGLSSLYGTDRMLVIFHVTCIAIFMIFQFALRFAANKE